MHVISLYLMGGDVVFLTLQISIIIGVLFFFGMIILLLKKSSLSLKNALLWLLTATVMLIFGLFPQLLVYISGLLGFEMPVNALFSLLLGFVILILLHQTAVISRQSENIKTLIQENALLEKRIRELESGLLRSPSQGFHDVQSVTDGKPRKDKDRNA